MLDDCLICLHSPSKYAVKESKFQLNVDTLYLIDGLQRYYAVKELGIKEYESKWSAFILTKEKDTVEDIQLVALDCLARNSTQLNWSRHEHDDE